MNNTPFFLVESATLTSVLLLGTLGFLRSMLGRFE